MIHVTSLDSGQSRLVKLDGTCDVRIAQELLVTLQEVCSDGLPTTVDGSCVESIDTACIQLLLAAKRDSSNLVDIQFGESEALRWIELAGVADFLLSTGRNSSDRAPVSTNSNS